jgi:malate dehydrogenase (oxaloacetate-decarboxylating)
MRVKGSRFSDETFVIVGFGQAGYGTAHHIAVIMREAGLGEEEIRARILAVDYQGLLMEDEPGLDEWQRPFGQRRGAIADWRLGDPSRITLEDVVANAKPTVLIGVTGQQGLFDRHILTRMGEHSDRPVILALSNPTAHSECTPEEALRFTGGRALVATGSPFPPVHLRGRQVVTSQCNNLYVFPGVGLGALVASASVITGEMFVAAAKALSAMVTPEQESAGLLLPPMEGIREVSLGIARAVAREARDAGFGRLLEDDELDALLRRAQWRPEFAPYRPGLR